eukprot:m.81325 g.81325  ORF g.81325 m.81325 type:complete len:950 (-) comp14690_c0_seq1:104-2953(-)
MRRASASEQVPLLLGPGSAAGDSATGSSTTDSNEHATATTSADGLGAIHPEAYQWRPSKHAAGVFTPVSTAASGRGSPETDGSGGVDGGDDDDGSKQHKKKPKKKLSMFFGVVVPNILSIFSVILFLRLGFTLGQAGYLVTIAMFALGYFVACLTVQSLAAISTNGAVAGGGVYFMISRALGPEFGGAIGLIFFFANVSASALYIIGLVEGLVASFGPTGNIVEGGLDDGRWVMFGYASAVLGFCVIVCMIGADFFAKTTFFIFLVVVASICAVFVSLFVEGDKQLAAPADNPNWDAPLIYSGFDKDTFSDNLKPEFGLDYTASSSVAFADVFAVLFNGCTGFMAGANMSGELADPSVAIPRGTFISMGVTLVIYLVLTTLLAFTCTRDLLQNNYGVLQDINSWPPIVAVGIWCATLSAGLSTLIGASRILQALAMDDLFGAPFRIFVGGFRSKEPHYAVLFSWLVVQALLLLGEVNSIAPIVAILFLLAYGATNLACLALELASASNWRPTFKYFSWHTSALGFVVTTGLMFMIEPLYTLGVIFAVLVLFVIIAYRQPLTDWGYISQALIYHQVRKYLLLLDERLDHVKYWRPQILFLTANPIRNHGAVMFLNRLKKGGLFLVGQVTIGELDAATVQLVREREIAFLRYKDRNKIKLFAKVVIDRTVRGGAESLMLAAGLGALHPNTVAVGFPEAVDDPTLQDEDSDIVKVPDAAGGDNWLFEHASNGRGRATLEQYAGILYDAQMLNKNILILRNFDKDVALGDTVDVWLPISKPLSESEHDQARRMTLFILQLAAVLQSSHEWRQRRLRIMLRVAPGCSLQLECERAQALISEQRISATIHAVTFSKSAVEDSGVDYKSFQRRSLSGATAAVRHGTVYSPLSVTDTCVLSRSFVAQHSAEAAVVMIALPPPPGDQRDYGGYVSSIEQLSSGLRPTVMVFGKAQVTM